MTRGRGGGGSIMVKKKRSVTYLMDGANLYHPFVDDAQMLSFSFMA